MSSGILKFATWNMGGGILGASHQRHCAPSLDYYVSVLKTHQPDVLCLQEAHDYNGDREGQTQYLSRRAGIPHALSFPVSESHLEDGSRLALGILSRFPVSACSYKQFPAPRLEAPGPHGEQWKLHDKGYVVGKIDVRGTSLGLVNGHGFPLHRFGASPVEPRFAGMWDALAEDLVALGDEGPALAAFDLNYAHIGDVLGRALQPGRYITAFDNTPTTPHGGQRDHILYSSSMRLTTTTVMATASDHAYCQVSLRI